MVLVGLTGSIAVGKSFVALVLCQLGCHVIDSDQTARKVVERGSEGLKAVVAAFGPDVLNADGSLNRSMMASIVFADESKRLLLNSVLHPLVFREQEKEVRQIEGNEPGRIVVVDAALMIESGSYMRFSKIIVVFCKPAIQLSRLMARNKISEDEATRLIAAQMPQDEKKKYADFLIDTSGGFESARHQTEQVFARLKSLD